jgi:hypothetical protein
MSPSPFYTTTPRYALRALLGSSNISDIDTGILAGLTDVENAFSGYKSGTHATRLAATALDGLLWRETDTGLVYVGTGTGWVAVAPSSPPLVTTLPGSPTDGQMCYFLADATHGVVWTLRYRAASTSTYKWEFVGGAGLESFVAASESTSSTTYTDLATVGPSVTIPTLPNGGDFDVTFGASVATSGSTPALWTVGLAVGGTVTYSDFFAFSGPNAGTDGASLSKTFRLAGVSGATLMKLQYKISGAAASFDDRFLQVTPVRVG